MKRKLSVLLLILACVLVFAGCKCEHEWVEADCVTAKTCSLCDEIEGAPLGHTWTAADCETPKTCETCGETEGEALGHSWADATCEAPKTCEGCGLTEGEALGHVWVAATTEAPKTCETCGATEGERIITDARFTTADASCLFGSWQFEMTMSASDFGVEGVEEEVPILMTMTFGNAGDLTMKMEFVDLEAFLSTVCTIAVDEVYAEMKEEGYSPEEADEAFKVSYGMTVPEYVASVYAEMDWDALMNSYTPEMVYYVEGDQLYIDYSWSGSFEDPGTITITGDTLNITDPYDSVDLTRVVDAM